ncbi:MAG: hypothetical protein QHH75_11840 [Bacillota bacterium]|nr:hypothetical protein [Bacillota bacterium]
MNIVIDGEAVWEPLEKVLGKEACPEFMYMGKTALGETWVFLYKHRITRKYLNLDGRGNTYRFALEKGGRYYPVSFWYAIKHVFNN